MQRGRHRCLGLLIPNLLLCLVVLCLPVSGQAVSPYQAVQQGNALYQNGQYAEAAEQYGSASQMLPDAAEIHFNQGNAAYKQQEYDKAREHYTQALQTTDRTLEGKVKYNLGNVEYQQALQNLQQPQVAMPHLRSAMTYYRDSLDVDPQQDARYNLELSHLLLHKLQQEQQQHNPPPQEQPQDQQSQPQQARQDGQQQGQQQQSQQQDKAPQQAPAPDPQQSQQQQAASSEPQGQQGEEHQDASQDNAPPPGEQTAAQRDLRPEEAARLLEAIRERGREADNQRQQRRAKARAAPVDKDW
jgi:tetratricopeptide (TPR) repeat protein